jgi:hypothetical protein
MNMKYKTTISVLITTLMIASVFTNITVMVSAETVTIEVTCDVALDHCLMYRDSDYYTAHDASVAQYQDWLGDTQMQYGQQDLGASSPYWYIYRYFAYFDTSGIPSDANIINVDLWFRNCGHSTNGPDPILMTFYDSSGTYPHLNLEMDDFNIDLYEDTGAGGFPVPANGDYTWTWDDEGHSAITQGGWTKIMFTTQADLDRNINLDKAFGQMRSDDGSGTNPPPVLTITYETAGDTTPPTPNPSTWATEPYATGEHSISMTATTASDPSGVEYFFDETSGNSGGSDSGWQSSSSYTDTGLSAGTTYTYRVRTRDKSPNQNAGSWSSSKSATTDTEESDRWTVIAYLCGDGNLGWWVEGCLDWMASVTGADDDVNIVVLIDGSGNHDTEAWYIDRNSNLIDIPWNDEVNMGNPNSLVDFAEYCIDNFPADHYVIIPQDHGGSWLGCCWDDINSNDGLNMDDLRTAFEDISSHIGKKIDIVFFNDCLMNSVEIAYQLQPYVDYQAGSETISWTSTCDNEYATILQNMIDNPDITPQELSILFTDESQPGNNRGYRTQCISTIDLNRMTELITHVNNLAEDLSGKLNDPAEAHVNEIRTARDNCEYTEGPYSGNIERIIDLYDFAQNIQNQVSDDATDSIAQNIMDSLEDDVILRYNNTDATRDFCHGMSIYFPDRSNRYQSGYTNDNEFTSDTAWNVFLHDYFDTGLLPDDYFAWDAYIGAAGPSTGCGYGTSFTFGEQEDAIDGYDQFDVEHRDSSELELEMYSIMSNKECHVDIRNGPAESKIWNLRIEWQDSSSSITVTLTWNIDNVPNEYSYVRLYDGDTQINMHASDSSYELTLSPGETRDLQIVCSKNAPLIANAGGPYEVNKGDSVTIYGSATGGEQPYEYAWDLDNDGLFGEEDEPDEPTTAMFTYSWDETNTYTIRLRVKDSGGNEACDDATVKVNKNKKQIIISGPINKRQGKARIISIQKYYKALPAFMDTTINLQHSTPLQQFFERFLNRFPNLARLFQNLLLT